MSVKGLGSKTGITQTAGRPKGSSIGYNPYNPKAPYIINYSRNSVNVHKGQSILRRMFGR